MHKLKLFVSTLIIAVLIFSGCSKDSVDMEATGKNTVAVYTVPTGMLRFSDVRYFLSESPFTTWDKFKPLKSVPAKVSATDSTMVNVSDYVGKTIYFIALRKYLLTDKYYSVTPTTGQSLANLKLIITDKPRNRIALITSEPKTGSFVPDKAKLVLTTKKGSAVVPNKLLFYGGSKLLWSAETERVLKEKMFLFHSLEKLVLSGATLPPESKKAYDDLVKNAFGRTNTSGVINIDIPVDEANMKGSNEHVFYTYSETGDLKLVSIPVNSLQLKATLSL